MIPGWPALSLTVSLADGHRLSYGCTEMLLLPNPYLPDRRHASLEQHVAVCRALARSIPASLPPAAVPQLTALASGWLAVPARSTIDTSTGRGEAAASQVQLQSEAVHLLISMVDSAKARLPAPAASQLLQAVCCLIERPPQPAGSIAAHELACGCMDLLAQMPYWCPQATKAQLATAVAAVGAVLGQQQSSSREETVPTTRLLCKLLRALQVLLAEVRRCLIQLLCKA